MQLTSLRPTADLFCSLLRDALKVELQKGNMKAVKGFVKMSYSEQLVANASDNSDEKAAAAEAAKAEDGSAAGTSSESMYLGGLGLKFKFPGDPKKYAAHTCKTLLMLLNELLSRLREASKTKLWTNYLRSKLSSSPSASKLTNNTQRTVET